MKMTSRESEIVIWTRRTRSGNEVEVLEITGEIVIGITEEDMTSMIVAIDVMTITIIGSGIEMTGGASEAETDTEIMIAGDDGAMRVTCSKSILPEDKHSLSLLRRAHQSQTRFVTTHLLQSLSMAYHTFCCCRTSDIFFLDREDVISGWRLQQIGSYGIAIIK